MRQILVASAMLASACGFNPPNGHLLCATTGKACPDGYGCVSGHCWTNGTAPADLDAGSDLSNGTDLGPALKANGQACSAGSECTSAVCADSVCCDRACSGQCEACNQPGANNGVCSLVTGTPIPPRLPCAGVGACLGVCGGTLSTCSYPAAGTICGGACDGKCDGAGACSGSGGSCAGGFACGVGACKTTCASIMDCQTNFQCNMATSLCERVPESNCLDGVDNNGDGLADCADPSCTAMVQCVPDVGVGADIGIVLATGPCPPGYDASTAYHGTLQGQSCVGCSCQTTCETYVHESNSSTCASNDGEFQLIGVADGSSSNCQNYLSAMTHSYAYADVPTPWSCNKSGTATQGAPTWGANPVYCTAHRSSTCGAGQICVAKTPSTPECSRVDATLSCPTGYTTGTNTVYYTGYTAGSCGACGCAKGTNACKFVLGGALVYDNLCANSPGANIVGPLPGGCGTTRAGSQYAAGAVFALTPSDNCTTSSTNTPPTPTGGTRFCCQ